MRTILAVLLLAAAVIQPTHHTASRGHHAASPRRYAVILVLDGARPQYFQPALMPHYRWLLGRGVEYTQAFVGQEIANTPPSHATIGTGVFPRVHGVQGFEWKDPRTGAAIRPTDLQPVQSGALEAILTAHHVPSIAAQVKSADRHDTVLAVGGHKCYAPDAMGTASADYILCAEIYHDRWVAQA
ncbi:MAG TPA: alkaline phosphatase family protein, partial [Chloroflexota bacterium]